MRVRLTYHHGSWVRARDAKPNETWWDEETIAVACDASPRYSDIVAARDRADAVIQSLLVRLASFEARALGDYTVSFVFSRVVVSREIRCLAGAAALIGAKQ